MSWFEVNKCCFGQHNRQQINNKLMTLWFTSTSRVCSSSCLHETRTRSWSLQGHGWQLNWVVPTLTMVMSPVSRCLSRETTSPADPTLIKLRYSPPDFCKLWAESVKEREKDRELKLKTTGLAQGNLMWMQAITCNGIRGEAILASYPGHFSLLQHGLGMRLYTCILSSLWCYCPYLHMEGTAPAFTTSSSTVSSPDVSNCSGSSAMGASLNSCSSSHPGGREREEFTLSLILGLLPNF